MSAPPGHSGDPAYRPDGPIVEPAESPAGVSGGRAAGPAEGPTQPPPTQPPPHRPPPDRRVSRPRSGAVRTASLVAAGVGVLVVACAGWIGVRGLLAERHLAAARTQLGQLERQILAGQTETPADLRKRLAGIRAETSAARRLTSDPIWSAAGAVPYAGCPAASASSLARVTGDLTEKALPPLATVSSALRPADLRSGSSVDLAAFAGLRAPLATARQQLGLELPRVRSARTCGVIGHWLGLSSARKTVLERTSGLASDADQASLAVRLVPPMLGQTGTRRYLLMVTNEAESRADGGIIGGWGVLTASRGHLNLTDVSGNTKLPGGQTQKRPAMALPSALVGMYGALEPTRVWANANLTPDYPTVNRFCSAMFTAGTGTAVDGTITVDPTTLAYLVAATRPAVLENGQVVRAGDLVRLTESTVYATISNSAAREAFFASVGRAVYHSVISRGGNTGRLLKALARAAGEGRLLIASNHPDEQKLIATTRLGGALPREPGPFLAVVTQNAAAGKLDYWMRRTTDYQLRRRPDGTADVTVTVRLTNHAPTGLPYYVRQRQDPGRPSEDNPGAQNKLSVAVYTGIGSGYLGGTVNGRAATFAGGVEQGRPVATTYVTVDRGATATVVLHVWEPSARAVLTVRPQPLITPERLTVSGIPWTTVRQPSDTN